MCGIVGFTGSKNFHSMVLQMNKVQKHRGPDDTGSMFCEQNKIHLAMSRLSILDLNNGHQPMSIMDERYWKHIGKFKWTSNQKSFVVIEKESTYEI